MLPTTSASARAEAARPRGSDGFALTKSSSLGASISAGTVAEATDSAAAAASTTNFLSLEAALESRQGRRPLSSASASSLVLPTITQGSSEPNVAATSDAAASPARHRALRRLPTAAAMPGSAEGLFWFFGFSKREFS